MTAPSGPLLCASPILPGVEYFFEYPKHELCITFGQLAETCGKLFTWACFTNVSRKSRSRCNPFRLLARIINVIPRQQAHPAAPQRPRPCTSSTHHRRHAQPLSDTLHSGCSRHAHPACLPRPDQLQRAHSQPRQPGYCSAPIPGDSCSLQTSPCACSVNEIVRPVTPPPGCTHVREPRSDARAAVAAVIPVTRRRFRMLVIRRTQPFWVPCDPLSTPLRLTHTFPLRRPTATRARTGHESELHRVSVCRAQ